MRCIPQGVAASYQYGESDVHRGTRGHALTPTLSQRERGPSVRLSLWERPAQPAIAGKTGEGVSEPRPVQRSSNLGTPALSDPAKNQRAAAYPGVEGQPKP